MGQPSHDHVTFVDGVAIDQGDLRIYLGSGFSTQDLDASRMLLLSGAGRWMTHDIPSRVISVHARRSPLELYGLGRDGFVSIATTTRVAEEAIPDAGTGRGKFGYVTQIRSIGEQLHVCGSLHQVYRRVRAGWEHIDDEILVRNVRAVGYNLNSIDGTAPNDIYTVGDRGHIFHYDGTRWRETGSPTNYDLERVLCASADEVWICGMHGILMRGNRSGWELLGDPEEFVEDFWGIAVFQDNVYLSTARGIVKWDGTGFDPVDVGVPFSGSFHRLTASDKTLWAVGVNDLVCFDGQRWTEVVYPGNQ